MTTLELEECVVSGQAFQTLLKSFKGLRVFKYHYGTHDTTEASRRSTEAWNPRGLIEILSTHASHSLVTLNLTRTRIPHVVHGDRLAGRIFVGSLRRFGLLRKLRADAAIFTEFQLENLITEYAKRYRVYNHGELVTEVTTTHQNLRDHARHLVDCLPPSLEELVLCSINPDDSSQGVEALFQDPPAMKEEGVPLLNKIVFECRPPPEILLKAWRDAGIQIFCLSVIA